MKRIALLGAGVMGTAMAIHLARNGCLIRLWGTERDEDVIETMRKTRACPRLGVAMPAGIELYSADELGFVLHDAEGIVVAVISEAVEQITRRILPWLRNDVIVINISKGIHPAGLTMLQLIRGIIVEELGRTEAALVSMGGPARAVEIVKGIYTEVVLSSADREAALRCLGAFRGPTLRVRFVPDVVGMELCAALKNGFAIAIGLCEGLLTDSDNMKAALFAEASLELGRIVVAMGGDMETALGPAGTGDLYVTSQGGRNRTLGKMLGQGMAVREAVESMQASGQTIEGYKAVRDGYSLARALEGRGRLRVRDDLPLLNGLYSVLFEGNPVDRMVRDYWDTIGSEWRRRREKEI